MAVTGISCSVDEPEEISESASPHWTSDLNYYSASLNTVCLLPLSISFHCLLEKAILMKLLGELALPFYLQLSPFF